MKGIGQAEEGSAIERQWGESIGGQTYPSDEAPLPGQRLARREDNKYPAEPPGGGDGDGRAKHKGFAEEAKEGD